MPIIKITDANAEINIPSDGKCIVDYYADWCGPCKMISPILDKIGNEGITIIKVDIDKCPDLAKKAGVTSIPMMQFYKNGKLTETVRGAHPEAVIRRKL